LASAIPSKTECKKKYLELKTDYASPCSISASGCAFGMPNRRIKVSRELGILADAESAFYANPRKLTLRPCDTRNM